jgi:hypothetical protein
MNTTASIAAVALVAVAALVIGALGLRVSRTTSDFVRKPFCRTRRHRSTSSIKRQACLETLSRS